ncbi:MAG: hypothetical protein QT11_C0001G0943 [archaeon GW2011_AR20]|nr:MAG: hypothetical protein QT11_C0001G0943 [archaeon GW2011_AR20]MBS3160166.1 hypothetical protein [Candidatus Woesearchaeota archaeon]
MSLSPEFDIIIIHPQIGEGYKIRKFHETYSQIPLIYCSRISDMNVSQGGSKAFFKHSINSKNKIDGTYLCGHIILKPFLEFIKYLTGKNKKHYQEI